MATADLRVFIDPVKLADEIVRQVSALDLRLQPHDCGCKLNRHLVAGELAAILREQSREHGSADLEITHAVTVVDDPL